MCGIAGEETLNSVPESCSMSGPITAISRPGQPHSGTSHSFYCLPDCHGRLADLRTWEELVLLTLTMSPLLCRFPIRTGAKLPIPQQPHLEVTVLWNICLWQIAAGGLAHEDEMRGSTWWRQGEKCTACEWDRPTGWKAPRQGNYPAGSPCAKH